MNFSEVITSSWSNLWIHRLRSILSLLGIVIGIAGVIAVVAIGDGGRKKIRDDINKMGASILRIGPSLGSDGNFNRDNRNSRGPQLDHLTRWDIASLRRYAPSVKGVTVVKRRVVNVSDSKSIMVWGVEPDFAGLAQVTILKGRFIKAIDIVAGNRICVIEVSPNLSKIFPRMPRLGETITLAQHRLRVVGFVSRGALGGWDARTMEVYVPIRIIGQFGQAYSGGEEETYVEAVSEDRVDQAKREAESILVSRRLGKRRFDLTSPAQFMKSATNMIQTVTLIVAGVALLSLLVGGVGIANIMLISVGERTREIGIRMAIGARKRDIWTQFLSEVVLLCLIGGILGIFLGLIIAVLVTPVLYLPFVFSWRAIMVGVIFSTAVGTLTGIFPALRASRMHPVEALRYE